MTDYDAPRNPDPSAPPDETLSDLKTRHTQDRGGATDVGEASVNVSTYYASLDLIDSLDGELSVAVLPMQGNEFTCSACFLVQHRNLLGRSRGRKLICLECAGGVKYAQSR